MVLSQICTYSNDKISIVDVNKNTYISTENMLPNKAGIIQAASLPSTMQVKCYKQGDVLVSNIRPYFKKIWFAEHEGGCSNDVLVFRAKETVNPYYLFYVISCDKFFEYAMATSKGTKMPRGDKKALMQYEIPEHNYIEQVKIADFLRCIDDKIAINNKINNNLLQQALSLFLEYYVKNSTPFDTLSLYDFAEYINGAAFKPKELGNTGLPVIKIAELKAGITDSTQYFSGDKDKKYIVNNKDILFSWSGNPETSIDVFVWTYGKGILNQHTFNVKSNFNCRWFTFLLLKYHKPIFTQIASNKQTTGLGHVTVSDLKRLTFPFDLNRIQSLEDLVSSKLELYFNNQMENQYLATMRDTLLPKLMSGEIDVSNINP